MAKSLLLRWQGLLHPADPVLLRLEWLSGSVLVLLLDRKSTRLNSSHQ